jgi:uncharacterized protein YebE (UPF0316 family)
MGNLSLFESGFFTWVVIPVLIFIARILDVSLGTVRLIFVSRGFKFLAPLVGFFEVLIWILAMGQIMRNLTNPVCYIAYAGGFAMGNFVGIHIAEKLSLGVVLVRVVTDKNASGLIESLKGENYGVTSIDGHGVSGQVKIIFTVVPRKEVRGVVDLVKKFDSQAFYSVEEVGFVEKGIFPMRKDLRNSTFLGTLWPFRKGK